MTYDSALDEISRMVHSLRMLEDLLYTVEDNVKELNCDHCGYCERCNKGEITEEFLNNICNLTCPTGDGRVEKEFDKLRKAIKEILN